MLYYQLLSLYILIITIYTTVLTVLSVSVNSDNNRARVIYNADNSQSYSSYTTGLSNILSIIPDYPLASRINNITSYSIYHLTDIHGWISGHQHQPHLDADFGDLVSLIERLKLNAVNNNQELLLFDTGDLIEGTGISDSTPIHGEYIFPVAKMADWDGLTSGNHDVTHSNTVDLIVNSFAPLLGDRYITSNSLLSTSAVPNNNPLSVSYRVLDTALGSRILIYGFIFNFTQNANNTAIHPLSNIDQYIEQNPYIIESLSIPNIDLIISLNHIAPQPGSNNEILFQYKLIRNIIGFDSKPIIFLTGHSHTKYYQELDPNCIILESGKYFETIGLLQFNINNNNNYDNDNNTIIITELHHHWYDTNKKLFYSLTNTSNNNEFMTVNGLKTRELIVNYTNSLKLNELLGCSQIEYNPYISINNNNSFYYLFYNYIMPTYQLNNDSSNSNIPFFITNNNAFRSILYSGNITKNDLFNLNPFINHYQCYYNINGTVLQNVLNYALKQNSNSNTKNNNNNPAADAADCTEPIELRSAEYYYNKLNNHNNNNNNEQLSTIELYNTISNIPTDSLPPFLSPPDFPIQPESIYNMIVADYEAATFLPYFQLLYPNNNNREFIPQPYIGINGPLTSTELIQQYFTTAEQFNCNNPKPFGKPFYSKH